MLKALTHSKTGRADRDRLTERGALFKYEDPLTATVFERLAYLPKRIAWDVLGRAVGWTLDGKPWRKNPPAGQGSWSFWPSYAAPADNRSRVEPDVVWSFPGGTAIVIEAKHHDSQHASQWVGEIEAVKAADGVARVILLAVGDAVPALDEQGRAQLRGCGATAVGHVAWPDLAVAADTYPALPPHVHRVMRDIVSALALWGYPPRRWFGTIVEYVPEQPLTARFEPMTAESASCGGFTGLHAVSDLDPRALDGWRPTS